MTKSGLGAPGGPLRDPGPPDLQTATALEASQRLSELQSSRPPDLTASLFLLVFPTFSDIVLHAVPR